MWVSVVLLAAGKGKRFGAKVPKPLYILGRKPLIRYSLERFQHCRPVNEIVIVASRQNISEIRGIVRSCRFTKVSAIVLGGARRQDSVFNGLQKIRRQARIVVIHDCARPFVCDQMIKRAVAKALTLGACVVAVEPKATIKQVKGGIIEKTLDRSCLLEVQTPQAFRKELLLRAFKKFSKHNVTDDASLVEKIGARVGIVRGSYDNIKITTPEDIAVANSILRGLRRQKP